MGLKAFRVQVNEDRVKDQQFRKGTSKKSIMDWVLKHKEFTKSEFLEAVQEMKQNGEVESKMDPATCARAWWNELYNKYGFIKDSEAE